MTVSFDRNKALKFQEILSKREVGSPVLYEGEITYLNKKTKTGKFTHSSNNMSAILRMLTMDDFLIVHPLLKEKNVSFIGAPVYEYETIDPVGGDIYFLSLP